jgi:hypothetical protein
LAESTAGRHFDAAPLFLRRNHNELELPLAEKELAS